MAIKRIQEPLWYRSVPKAAALLVMVAVINFVIMIIRGYLAELELRNSGWSVSHWTPYRAESLWLVIAATCLVSTRIWILVVSTLTSGWVLYVLSYVRWTGLARNTYELPILSWLTTEKLVRNYLDRPDVIFELVLASLILICSILLIRSFTNES